MPNSQRVIDIITVEFNLFNNYGGFYEEMDLKMAIRTETVLPLMFIPLEPIPLDQLPQLDMIVQASPAVDEKPFALSFADSTWN